MLKEYLFSKRYERLKYGDSSFNVSYRVNQHKVSVDIFDIIFNKVQLSLRLDTTYTTFWMNPKTGNYVRYEYWTFNEETSLE